LFVIDGAKALRAGIERVFGNRAEVQRCQIHKRRNVKEHLPKSAQADTDRRIRNAYAMTEYAAAKAELEKIFRQLERINPSAARSGERLSGTGNSAAQIKSVVDSTGASGVTCRKSRAATFN
jgi:transposase-like protein